MAFWTRKVYNDSPFAGCLLWDDGQATGDDGGTILRMKRAQEISLLQLGRKEGIHHL
jgi:hypothetical protein